MGGDAGISAFPDGDNIFNWVGTIQGPAGTVRGTRAPRHGRHFARGTLLRQQWARAR